MAEKKDEVERPIEYVLTHSIQAYGEEVKVIRMRKPNGGDLIRAGNPLIFYPHCEPVKFEHDYAKLAVMIARLSDVPSSSLSNLSSEDMAGLAWTLSPFFMAPN